MRQHWWKLLGVLILVYALVAGLLVPLKPNLVSVSPTAAVLGQTQTLDLVGYNTRFLADGGQTKAWLNFMIGEEHYTLAADAVQATDDRRARVSFTLPDQLPTPETAAQPMSLIISGPANGTFVVPGAVTVRQTSAPADPAQFQAAWQGTGLRADELTKNTSLTFPYRGLLSETIRNTYFHVSLWFAMLFLFIAAMVYAVKHLRAKSRAERDVLTEPVLLTEITRLERTDHWSVVFTGVGMLFGVLGLLTGAVWAKYTWGSWWNWDIKQFTTLIALLIYAGYFVLRAAFPDPEQRGRLGAVYNIFAFACLIPLIYILPRMSATSLHPGAEGNPAMGGEDLDNTMRMVFYPTIIGWTLFGGWMAGVAYRARIVGERLLRRSGV